MKQTVFEIEAGTMNRFLDLLRGREDGRAPSESEALPRRAVFVAPLTRARNEGGVPVVTRRVRASFVYGSDLVILTRLTYDGYELGPPAEDTEKNAARQDEVLDKTRRQIQDWLLEQEIELPIITAWLKPAAGGTSGQER